MALLHHKGWMVDLTVKVAGVFSKHPISPTVSKLVFDGLSAKKGGQWGWGIDTKTFTTSSEFRIRVRLYPLPQKTWKIV